MGLFVTEEENFAILGVVKQKLDYSPMDSDNDLQVKISLAPKMREWVHTTVPWRMRFCYYSWIDYYIRECKRRLKDNKLWRDVEAVNKTIPRMP